MRSRCKTCRKSAMYSYQDGSIKIDSIPAMLDEWAYRRSLGIRKSIYNEIEPKFYRVSYQSYKLTENKISVDVHRSFSTNDITYIFICACGSTMWAHTESVKAFGVFRRAAKRYPKSITVDIEKF